MSHATNKLRQLIQKSTQSEHIFLFSNIATAALALTDIFQLQTTDTIAATPIAHPIFTSLLYASSQATPLWCDTTLHGNIDPLQLKRERNTNTKLLLVNNFAGTPCDYAQILQISTNSDMLLCNDITYALGAEHKQTSIAAFADVSLINFEEMFAIKGACICTNEKEIASLLQHYTSSGLTKSKGWNYDLDYAGIDFSLDRICAETLVSHVENFITQKELRQNSAEVLANIFSDSKLFNIQKVLPGDSSAYAFFPIILNPELQCPKEDIYFELQKIGIDVGVHYKPLYQLSFYKKRHQGVSLPVANDFYRSELSLPLTDMNVQQTETMGQKFLQIIEKYSYRGCSF